MKRFKRLLVIGGILVVILVALFSYLNSAFFVRANVLPVVARKVGLPVTVTDVSFSILSGAHLRGVKVGGDGDELVQFDEVEVRYAPLALLGGKLHVRKLLVRGGKIAATSEQLTEIQERLAESDDGEKPAKSGGGMTVVVDDVVVENVAGSYAQLAADSTPMRRVEWDGLAVSIPHFAKAGDTLELAAEGSISVANLKLAEMAGADHETASIKLRDVAVKLADIRLGETMRGGSTTVTLPYVAIEAGNRNAVFQDSQIVLGGPSDAGKVTLNFGTKVTLTEPKGRIRIGRVSLAAAVTVNGALKPQDLTLNAGVGELSGQMGGIDLAGHALVVEGKIRRAEQRIRIEQLGVTERLNDKVAGSIGLVGSVLPEPLSLEMDVDVKLPPHGLLNVLGGFLGEYNFGDSQIAYQGRLKYVRGDSLSVDGKADMQDLSVRRGPDGKASPPLDVRSTHRFFVNLADGVVELEAFDLTVANRQRELCRATLSDSLSFGLDGRATGNGELKIHSEDFDLGLVAPLLPAAGPIQLLGGKLDNELTLKIADDGANVSLVGATVVDDLAFSVAGHEARGMHKQADFSLTIAQRERMNVEVSGVLDQGGQVWGNLEARGNFTLRNGAVQSGDGNLVLRLPAGAAFDWLGKAFGDVDFGGTNATLDTTVSVNDDRGYIVVLDSRLAEVTASSPSRGLPALSPVTLSAAAKASGKLGESMVNLDIFSVTVAQGGTTTMALQLRKGGSVDLSKPNALPDLSLRLQGPGLDLAVLAPLLPADAAVRLTHGRLVPDLTAEVMAASNEVRVLGDLKLDNTTFVIRDTVLPAVRVENGFDLLGSRGVVSGKITSKLWHSGTRVGEFTADGRGTKGEQPSFQVDWHAAALGADLMAVLRPLVDDLDVGRTVLAASGRFARTPTGTVVIAGEGKVSDFTLSSVSRKLEKATPVQISWQYDSALQPKELRVNTLKLSLVEGDTALADLTLQDGPAVVTLGPGGPEPRGGTRLRLSVRDFGMALLIPLAAPVTGVRNLHGTATAGIDLVLDPGNMTIQGQAGVQQFMFEAQNVWLGKPLNGSADFALGYRFADGVMTISRLRPVLGTADETWADVNVTGTLDTRLTGNTRSVLKLNSDKPLNIGAIQDVIGTREQTAGAAPPAKTGGDDAATGELIRRIQARIEAHLAQVLWRQMTIEQLEMLARMRDGKLHVDNLKAMYAGGSIDAKGTVVDLSQWPKLGMGVKVDAYALPVGPLAQSFAPQLPYRLDGGLKSLSLKADSPPMATAELLGAMTGSLNYELNDLRVQRGGEAGGVNIVDLVLTQVFPLTWNDFSFAGGSADLALDRGDLAVKSFDLHHPQLLVQAGGNVRLRDGKWLPDTVDLTMGFAGRMLEAVKAKSIPTPRTVAAYQAAPPLSLSGNIFSKDALLRVAAEYVAGLGVEKGKEELRKKLGDQVPAGVLDSIFGGGKGKDESSVKPAEDGKTQPGGTTKDAATEAVRGIVGGFLRGKQDDKKK